jgi:hypothetical protein
MMRRRCTRCGNRLRIRSRQCRHCGAREELLAPGGSASWLRRLGTGVGILVTLLVLVFAGKWVVEPEVVADWYAEIAVQHLPRQFSSFAPSESPRGAFYYCIRRVVKDHMEPSSVATFPSTDESNTVALGEGRYRVGAHVLEDLESGERLRREFTCTANFQRGRWVLEQLNVEGTAHAMRAAAARSP